MENEKSGVLVATPAEVLRAIDSGQGFCLAHYFDLRPRADKLLVAGIQERLRRAKLIYFPKPEGTDCFLTEKGRKALARGCV